jgi:cadherin-like protein
VNCRRVLWPVLCGLLIVQTLSGCNHGDENKDPIAGNDMAITAREVPVTVRVLTNDSDPEGTRSRWWASPRAPTARSL